MRQDGNNDCQDEGVGDREAQVAVDVVQDGGYEVPESYLVQLLDIDLPLTWRNYCLLFPVL